MMRGGFLLGLALLALILREQRLRLLLEAKRLVELGFDPVAALVDELDHHLVHAEIDEPAEKDHEGHRYPEFGVELEHLGPQRLRASATAAATMSRLAGAMPISRSTIAAAASVAMPRTLAIAADLVAAMPALGLARCGH